MPTDYVAFVEAIAAAPTFSPLRDTFDDRTLAASWGSLITGQVWSNTGGAAADHSVAGGVGRHGHPAVNTMMRSLADTGATDVRITVDVILPVVPTGAPITLWVVARAADVNNYYTAQLTIATSGAANILLLKRVGGVLSGSLASAAAGTHTAGARWLVSLDLVGTTVRASAWMPAVQAQPSWQVSVTDPDLVTGTLAGVLSRLETGNTNGATVVSWDNVTVVPPGTRLDLNDGRRWGLNYEGTDLSPPPLRRAVAQTLLTDGARIPAAAYDNRTLRLRLDLLQPTVDDAFGEVQRLMRELDRPTNILKWQPAGASSPVFFRTFRSDTTRITEYPGAGLFRTFELAVLAEPFAYGIKEIVPTATVSNNPAAASNGMFFDIAAVKGDVETPVNLRVTRSVTPSFAGLVSCVSVRRRGTPASMPYVLQAETMVADADTSIQANSVTFSGAGQNYMRTTFATLPGMESRVHSTLFPAVSSADVRGTYRVFARVSKTVGSDSIRVALGYGAANSPSAWLSNVNDSVSLVLGATSPVWVDLGQLSIAGSADPIYDGYSGTQLPASGIGISLQAQRVSGTGSLDWDAVLLMPADDRLAVVRYANVAAFPALDYEVLDSVYESVWTQEAGAVHNTGTLTASKFVGGLPMISPGVTNRICWLLVANGDTNIDDLTYSTVIDAYYWPRYLYVRPATT